MIAIRFRTSQIFGNPRPAIVLAIRIALFILLTNFQSSVAMSISRLLPNVFRAAGSTAVAHRLLPQRTMVLSCLALFTLTTASFQRDRTPFCPMLCCTTNSEC